jgi:riboflavin transporter FmnP
MDSLKRITWGALFIALGLLIPLIFHAVGLGQVFLPMHIPVLLCGFFTGPVVGFVVGFVTPLLSAVFTGMPPLAPPVAQKMMFELGAYGLLTGLLYQRTNLGIYPTLIISMIGGRLVYGVLGYAVLPLFGLEKINPLLPVTYSLLQGIPGIILQLVVIPATVYLIERNPDSLFVKPGRADS